MCRWFAYISPAEPCLLADVLITPANSISKQCSHHYLPKLMPHGQEAQLDRSADEQLRLRNVLLNMDGLGVAWYTATASAYQKNITGMRPALYKTQAPPINDLNFNSLCANTESRCVFAHIRATSGSVVTQVNSHPFAFGRHVFMHNGIVEEIAAIRREMTQLMSFDAYCNILGSTDSEHAAAVYMTNLTNGGDKSSWEKEYPLEDMFAAMRKTVIQIMELQNAKLKGFNSPNSLNFCTTDGKKMVAIRFRNHATQEPPSLYWSEFAGRTLNTKYPGHPDGEDTPNENAVLGEGQKIGKHTIVASEPTTYDPNEWHLITRNHALLVDEFGKETERPLEYPAEFNVKDPSDDQA